MSHLIGPSGQDEYQGDVVSELIEGTKSRGGRGAHTPSKRPHPTASYCILLHPTALKDVVHL